VRTKQNWSDWILFILQAVDVTARQTINQIARIQLLFDQTVEQVRSQAPKVYSKELIEVLFEYPYSKIEYLVDRLLIDRRTASKYLRSLEQIGVLRAEKKWKETLFINVKLFNLLRQ
jgi:Fic family protein